MDNKYIFIGLLIVVLILLCGLIAFSMLGQVHAYKNFTCNDTGTTFEVPADLKVRVDNSYGGMRDSVMSTPDGDIVIQRTLSSDSMMQDISSNAYDSVAQMDNSYDGQQINGMTIHSCSRTAKNEATGEAILVTSNKGDNETVEHIINSIKWGNNSAIVSDNTTSTVSSTTTSSSSEPHYDAYCQYCGKGIIWPDEGEQWYICDECMKTHEKEINDRLEAEAESVEDYDYEDYDYEDYDYDDEGSLV